MDEYINMDNCECYDNGYCFSLGRPLTEEEEIQCEFACVITDNNKDKENNR